MNEILKLAEEYKNLVGLVNTRRKIWDDTKEELIQNTLEKWADKVSMDLYVGMNNHMKNRKAIYLSFQIKRSGIAIVQENSIQSYVVEPNYLCYSQTVNGKILVWIHFSYVKEIQPKTDPYEVNYLEPEDISVELIESHIKLFLKKIIQHEKEVEKNPIGFNNPN